MFKLPSAGTEPGTLDSARKAMMPSIAKRPLLISVRSLESHESAEIETIAAREHRQGWRVIWQTLRRIREEAIDDPQNSKNTLRRHPTRDFSAFHSSDLFFCRLKGSKSSNGMGCGISFFRDGNAPGLPPRM